MLFSKDTRNLKPSEKSKIRDVLYLESNLLVLNAIIIKETTTMMKLMMMKITMAVGIILLPKMILMKILIKMKS